MASVIQPCPFCGSVDCYSTGTDHPRAVVSVHCNGCGADGPCFSVEHTFTRRPMGKEARAAWDRVGHEATEKAIAAWNRGGEAARAAARQTP